MDIFLFYIHIVQEFLVQPVVAALCFVFTYRVIFVNAENFDICKRDLMKNTLQAKQKIKPTNNTNNTQLCSKINPKD